MKNQFSPIPSRESCHAEQILSLLQISQTLQPYLLLRPAEIGVEEPKMEGGVTAAAAVTFIGVCAKLDEILADKTRWSLTAQDDLYASLVKTQEEHQAFLQAQTAAANGIRRPSFQLKPMLVEFDGQYLACYGDVNDPAHSLIGVGATPEKALEDFDRAFTRTPLEQVVLAAEETAEPKKSRKKK